VDLYYERVIKTSYGEDIVPKKGGKVDEQTLANLTDLAMTSTSIKVGCDHVIITMK